MTIAISDITKLVVPEVGGCLDARIDIEVIRAVRTLCEKSRVWKQGFETTVSTPEGPEFDIDLPNGTDLVSVDYVTSIGLDLEATTEYELNRDVPYWRTHAGTPSHFYTDFRTKLIGLYPTPSDSFDLQYEVTLKPGVSATELPDFFAEQFVEVIIDGALSRLLAMNSVPWMNHSEADRRKADFNAGIAMARDKAIRGVASHQSDMHGDPLL